jgi:hypothetical protein
LRYPFVEASSFPTTLLTESKVSSVSSVGCDPHSIWGKVVNMAETEIYWLSFNSKISSIIIDGITGLMLGVVIFLLVAEKVLLEERRYKKHSIFVAPTSLDRR